MNEPQNALAIFIDFENLALGFQGRRDRFDIERVLERLVEKGKIVVKKAYADWSRFATLHRAAARSGHRTDRNPAPRPDRQELRRHPPVRRCDGPGLLQGPHRHLRHRLRRQRFFAAGVEAQGTGQARHRPGDAGIDLRPAARQLRRVHLLRRPRQDADSWRRPSTETLPETKRKAFALLLESLLALRRENKEVLWSSMVKDTMKRKKPSFNESYHGYRTLQRIAGGRRRSKGLLELDTDKRSRTYVVTRFGTEMTMKPSDEAPATARPVRSEKSGRPRWLDDRRRRRRKARP